MGLFGRFTRKSGDREDEGSHRCSECGMTGGNHTDWCPAVSHEKPGVMPGTTPEPDSKTEGPGEAST